MFVGYDQRFTPSYRYRYERVRFGRRRRKAVERTAATRQSSETTIDLSPLPRPGGKTPDIALSIRVCRRLFHCRCLSRIRLTTSRVVAAGLVHVFARRRCVRPPVFSCLVFARVRVVFAPNPRFMPFGCRVMTLVKWAVLPLTVFTILLAVMRGQAKSSTNNGPKVTDVVSEQHRPVGEGFRFFFENRRLSPNPPPPPCLCTRFFFLSPTLPLLASTFNRCGSTSGWARTSRNAWKSACSARPCRRPRRTSSSCPRGPRAKGTRAVSSTGSSRTS